MLPPVTIMSEKSSVYKRTILITLFTIISTSSGTNDGSIREYCQDESFSASCDNGEVIMMTSARYGRLKLGRCVKRSLGFLGCAAEALRLVDSKCSGHRQCGLSIMDPELRALEPCPDDVTWHMEASYDCVRVVTRRRHECHQKHSIELTSPSGFLSSEFAETSGIGSSSCPWEIVAPSGQTINITLYNFVHNSPGGLRGHGASCVVVAKLAEKSTVKSITACVAGSRMEFTYLSTTNQLTVSFPGISSHQSTPPGSRTHFLLSYHFEGCADIKRQQGTVMTRSGKTLEVQCTHTGETWFLTCQGTQWSGVLGNCSRQAQPWAIGGIFQSEDNFPFGILLVVAVGVALGIFLGGTLLLVVSLYMKRRRRHQEARPVLHDDVRCRQQDDYYRKQELIVLENKDEKFVHPDEDYKLSENRVSFSAPYPPPPPRNTHHVYESPKFT